MHLARDTAPRGTLAMAPELRLALGRAHEVAGPSRHLFAVLAGAATQGPILWFRPRWLPERPNGDGLRHYLDPTRIVFGGCRGAVEILWATEEALRSGRVPLVVAELPAPPPITPVRRLHLAAEAGSETGRTPLALLLTPDAGGAPAVETRWHLAPRPGWAVDGRACWRLARTRARMAPPAAWDMRIEAARVRLAPVTPTDPADNRLAPA